MRITMLGTGTGLIQPKRRSPSVLIETDTTLTIHGYPTISKDIATLARMMVPELNIARDLRIVGHAHGEVQTYGKLAIMGVSVKHVPTLQAVSFAFEHAGQKVVVTGDLGWDEAILPLLQDADIAIIDASASQEEFEAEPHRSHLAPIQCGQLASQANVKHLVLTSLYDRESAANITAAVRKHYAGTLTIPRDQQTFVI